MPADMGGARNDDDEAPVADVANAVAEGGGVTLCLRFLGGGGGSSGDAGSLGANK